MLCWLFGHRYRWWSRHALPPRWLPILRCTRCGFIPSEPLGGYEW